MQLLKKKLEEMLLESGKVTEEQLSGAVSAQKEKNISLRDTLIDQGILNEKDLVMILSQGLSIPPVTLKKITIPPDLLHLMPEHIMRKYSMIPIAKVGKCLTVVMVDPLNVLAMDELKIVTRYDISCVLATVRDIQDKLDEYFARDASDIGELLKAIDLEEDSEAEAIEEEVIDVNHLEKQGQEAPVIKLVNYILVDAINKRASDIHIEPFRTEVRVRFRIDGALYEQTSVPKKYQNAISARIKIISKLDITEFRIPQDGRFKITYDNRDVDFRVSILPVAHGGKIVMRALDRSSLSLGLEKLGYLPATLKRFSDALSAPFGMILITGPTGSGKSTTLYTVLNEFNTPERNLITVEDPVEYQLEGITQMQVINEVGFTFSEGLRSILRQTPDVIMVGEIRDADTADISIKAALTGHLVFSTLHTNDASSAMTRLRDMGVEPFLLSSSIVMVVAQRLCRRNCPHCLEPYQIDEKVLMRAQKDLDLFAKNKTIKAMRGKGCPKCQGTGYLGRIAIGEVLIIDDVIREMVMQGKQSADIKAHAVKKGMYTLRREALERFCLGDTTLEEVLRVTSED